MESLISSELKQAALGQCLLKAVKPKNGIPPLLFALAVEIDHTVGAKALLTTACRPGYTLGWDEVRRFKQSVAMDNCNGDLPLREDAFYQWVADNADHNANTLDGKQTFHLMGIIECGNYKPAPPLGRVRGISKIMKSEEATNNHLIKIHWYDHPDVRSLSKLILKPIDETLFHSSPSEVKLNIDILWHAAGLFRKAERQGPRPNWNGYMDLASLGLAHPAKSTTVTLPFVDLNPSDESCIFSTIMYVIELSQQKEIPIPCLTFDQPLWIKAVEIIKTKQLNIVVRLGGFHCLMSCAGSLGMIMEGSGLAKVMETVYGSNIVQLIPQIASRKKT